MTGRFDEASAVLEEAIGHAAAAPAAAARASLVRLLVRLRTGADGWSPDTVERRSTATIAIFEAAGDEAGLAMAWRLLAWAAGTACRFGDAAEARDESRRARPTRGRRPPGAAGGDGVRGAASLGPTLVDEAIASLRGVLSSRPPATASRKATSSPSSAACTRCRASSTTRVASSTRARALLEELGLQMDDGARRAWRAGARAARRATSRPPSGSSGRRTTHSTPSASGALLSTVAGLLAQTLLEQGDAGRGGRCSANGAASSTTEADIATQGALALRPRHGSCRGRERRAEAEAIVREAIELPRADRRDRLPDRGPCRPRRGPRRRRADRRGTLGLGSARGLAEKKGGVVILSGVLRRLEDLDAARTTKRASRSPVPRPVDLGRCDDRPDLGLGIELDRDDAFRVEGSPHVAALSYSSLWKTFSIL